MEKKFNERYADIGFAVAYYRKKEHLTQEQLAEKLEISRQHLGSIEAPNIDRAVSLDLLFKIADALSIEPYLLLKFPNK